MMQPRTSVGRDIQDALLSRLATARQITTVYLRNRMSLRGRILRFDPYVLLLEPVDGGPIQLVYKSAIVAVSGPRRGPGPVYPRGAVARRPARGARETPVRDEGRGV